ncbi:MAG: tetratricopeptide repeat protein [Planctomycetota bacterium]
MNHLLRLTFIALGLGGLFFVWSSARGTARRESDRPQAAESPVCASEFAVQLTPEQPTFDSLEQPSSQRWGGRTAPASDVGSSPQAEESDEPATPSEASTGFRKADPRQMFSVDELKPRMAILSALHSIGSAPEERAHRIELMEQYLSLFPRDPAAEGMLESLIAEKLGSDASSALDALDRYGSQVMTEPAKLDGMRGNLLVENRRFEDGRACYERVLRTGRDERAKADASFWIATSCLNEGRDDEAKARFQSLISQYEGDQSLELFSTLQGARNQLELIEKYKPKRD